MSYAARWALQAVSSSEVLPPVFSLDAMNVHEEAKAYHTALMEGNITTDALDPRLDLSKYRLVIAPRLYCLDAETSENLLRFVENGGWLCLTPRSGVTDEFNVIFEQPAPGPLAGATGVEVDEYGALDAPVSLRADQTGLEGVTEGTVWADEIHPATAKVLAVYDQGWRKGMPAITLHPYGKGQVAYVGTLLRGGSLQAWVGWLCREAGILPVLQTPLGVRAYERRSDRERLVFLLNLSETEQAVRLADPWEDVLTGKLVEQVDLPLAGVSVIRRKR
jgi:beta-galactosidase